MRSFLVVLIAITVGFSFRAFAEDAAQFEAQGIAALKQSQINSDSIISAAVYFGQAVDAFDKAGDEAKTTEMNSFLYWCKKKMTLRQMDAFLKGDNPAAAQRLQSLEKSPPKAAEAKPFYERAEAYAQAHSDEHLLIAIRFYEVADRFKGDDVGMQAMDRSLKEMTLAQPPAATPAEKKKPGATPAIPGKRVPIPTAVQQREAEKTIKEIFKNELSKTAASEKIALAEKFRKQADEAPSEDGSRYSLMTQAARLAAEAGDLQILNGVLDKLSLDFDGDLKDVKKVMLGIAVSKVSDPKLAKLASAYKTVVDKPDDTAANMLIGKSRCLQGDFEHGLQFLAKSNNPALMAIIKNEPTALKDTTTQIAQGDSWWAFADKTLDKEEKSVYRALAAYWYGMALPNSTGLAKAKVEKRLAEGTPITRAPQVVDILKLINPNRDTVAGQWKLAQGTLESVSASGSTRIQFPYLPGPEYDLHVILTPTSEHLEQSIIIPCAGQQVKFGLNGWGNSHAILHSINGKDQNETFTPNSMHLGAEYDVMIHVRKNSISTTINNKKLIDFHFDEAKFSLRDDWKMRDERAAGLLAWQGTVKARVIEIYDLGGGSRTAPK